MLFSTSLRPFIYQWAFLLSSLVKYSGLIHGNLEDPFQALIFCARVSDEGSDLRIHRLSCLFACLINFGHLIFGNPGNQSLPSPLGFVIVVAFCLLTFLELIL